MASTAHKDEESMREYQESEDSLNAKIDKLTTLIKNSKHFVIFTGAGISTSAGIPDFRGPEGKWTLEAQGRKRTKPVTSSIKAIPTPTHMAIVELQRQGICKYLISQNCDGLHRRSSISPEKISELHGNGNIEHCETCGYEYLRDFHCTRLKKGRDHYTGRHCTVPTNKIGKDGKPVYCNGRLLNSTIDFGQDLPARPLQLAEENSLKADLHLVLGSSLTVRPACNMPKTTAKHGKGNKDLVIVNLQKTPLDHLASLRIFSSVDIVMKGVMQRLGIKIPKFRLNRYIKVSVGEKGDVLEIGGFEKGTAGQQIPASVIKALEVQKVVYVEEPFIIALDGDKNNNLGKKIKIKLQFMGHYKEPNLEVEVGPLESGKENMYHLQYTPETGKWKYKEVSLSFSSIKPNNVTQKLK